MTAWIERVCDVFLAGSYMKSTSFPRMHYLLDFSEVKGHSADRFSHVQLQPTEREPENLDIFQNSNKIFHEWTHEVITVIRNISN